MFDHKHTLGYLCAHIARRHANMLREALVPLGLLPAQLTALAEITLSEGLTQKQLVERLQLEQPGVARTLTGLEAMGWIVPRTGRSPGLFLTDRAREILPKALDMAAAIDRQMLIGFSRTERAHLMDELAGLTAN